MVWWWWLEVLKCWWCYWLLLMGVLSRDFFTVAEGEKGCGDVVFGDGDGWRW
jgi:hypothetical protein